MLYFPNAKINLGLHVTEKRADGFHNLETIFYPLQLSDVLEILPQSEFEFKLTGIEVDGNPENNLCIKAYSLMREEFNLPPIYMQLHKIIPMGAGLGGGSSDAAFVLSALNTEFNLSLNKQTLKKYAARLGSDCAFFIDNTPSLATGRGEILTPINVDLKGWQIVLVKPHLHVNTAEAYAGITPKMPQKSLVDIIRLPVEEWRNDLINDFESCIFKHHPYIGEVKQMLYKQGAVYAAMSGSGSTVFGLFKTNIDLKGAFSDCFVYSETLL